MTSLQQLLGKEDTFFTFFEASAAECVRSVQALRELVSHPGPDASLTPFTDSRRRDKAIHVQLVEALCGTVLTALEREDIMALANSLYKIPKTAEKIGERLLLAPEYLEGIDLGRQVHILEQAATTLQAMVQLLSQQAPIGKIQDLNQRLQSLEGDADKLMLELLQGLYRSSLEGRKVVFLKDLYELVEKATDRFRDAGNVIVQITLKAG